MGGNNRPTRRPRRPLWRQGFTLVELLVVIGIISMLIGILLPALSKVRAKGQAIQCASNLRQLGVALETYRLDNNGWLYPVGPDQRDPEDGKMKPTTYGTNVAPHLRWPMRVWALDVDVPEKMPYEPSAYISEYPNSAYDMVKFPVAPFTPRLLVCPADLEPGAAHTYVLNKHLADKKVRAGSRNFGENVTSSEVVVAGEKKGQIIDYYMESSDFTRVVERYAHGVNWGTNYLFHDGHVATSGPAEALLGIDPWDVKDPTTKPAGQ